MEENKNPKTTRNIIIALIVVIVVLIVAFAAYALNGYNSAPVSSTDEITETEEQAETPDEESETPEEQPQEEEEPQPEEEITKFYTGLYEIGGGEMAAGEYVLQPNYPEGYFELLSEAPGGDPSTVIVSGKYNTQRYITVENGQYLSFEGVAIPIDEAESYIPKDGVYPSGGMYLTGRDIPAGTYTVLFDADVSESGGYMEVTYTSTGLEADVKDKIFVTEETEITLENGDYVRLEGVKITTNY